MTIAARLASMQQGATDPPALERARRLAAEVQAWHQARMEREPVRYFESEQLAALALVRAPAPAAARSGARGGRRRLRARTCPHRTSVHTPLALT